MPILFSYDLRAADKADHNRLQSAFKRFGWEHLGGSAFRYPALAEDAIQEDWLNHVVPALMVFRAYALSRGAVVTKFSLDAQTSTGYRASRNASAKPQSAEKIVADTRPQAFGKKQLVALLGSFAWPYASASSTKATKPTRSKASGRTS